MCRHLSNAPLARNCPSGEKATEYTGCECFTNECRQVPVSGSHKRMVESKDADAKTSGALGLLDPGPVGLHRIV
jgi:hypothetical protein